MNALFADTFYWIALADFGDDAHQQALSLTAAMASSQIVTTDEVLTEYLTFFAGAPPVLRQQAAESVQGILTSSAVRVIPQAESRFLRACSSFAPVRTRDTAWWAAISMQTMRKDGLVDVLTNDRHFEQEGFRALFRDA